MSGVFVNTGSLSRYNGEIQALSRALSQSVFAGAAAAYSLRIPQGSTYSGPLLRVRRSSDNAEQDILAVPTLDANGNRRLDTTALLAFVGAGNGFVTTWYDQSGNGRNAVQPTASAQPRIVNAGVIDTAGGLPTLVFSGGQWIIQPTILARNTYPFASVECVYQSTSTTNTAALWGGDGGPWPRFHLLNFSMAPGLSWGISNGTTAIQQTALMANTNRHVYSHTSQVGVANGSCVFIDGATGVAFTEAGIGTPTALTIGAIAPAGTYPMLGNVQEFIYRFYAPTTTQRQAIERSQGAAFGITVI